jgi:orotate phosphoribosyltransferase
MKPDFVLALEDVGTKGTTSASAVVAARKAGAARAEVLNTWQRRPELEELVGIGAVYSSMIHEDMPTLTAAECRASGYCAQGWELIEHAQ